MSLLDEFRAALDEDGELRPYEVEDYIENVILVQDKCLGSGRWTSQWLAVFKRWGTGPHNSDEFVALSYELPCTEYQEGSEGPSEVYEVEPVEVTVTKYRRKQ